MEEQSKTVADLEKELLEVRSQLVKEQQVNLSTNAKALRVYEENQMYKASPELAVQMAEMTFQLQMAERFIKSGAFKANNAEQAYVVIKAGAEMGMKPVEAMQALYCVNGAVKIYGDKMVSRISGAGYKLEYLNESPQGVTVKVTHPNGFEASETVQANDPILQKSNAFKFAPKNKMRFHAIRLIASFHLPHLFTSVQDEFTDEFHEWEKEQPKGIDLKSVEIQKEIKRAKEHIEKAQTLAQLEQIADLVDQYEIRAEYDAKFDQLQNQAA